MYTKAWIINRDKVKKHLGHSKADARGVRASAFFITSQRAKQNIEKLTRRLYPKKNKEFSPIPFSLLLIS
ncbi:MAG: hypothetical protein D3908_16765 [Candidatus Electrothrix sp. AUS4]|nr:hypothetical protein [Candidatus Electrothrix sp. AUS4]